MTNEKGPVVGKLPGKLNREIGNWLNRNIADMKQYLRSRINIFTDLLQGHHQVLISFPYLSYL